MEDEKKYTGYVSDLSEAGDRNIDMEKVDFVLGECKGAFGWTTPSVVMV